MGKDLSREPELCAVGSCGILFSDTLSYIRGVALAVLGRGRGVGGLIQEGVERAVLLAPGNKRESGWFPAWGRHICSPLL